MAAAPLRSLNVVQVSVSRSQRSALSYLGICLVVAYYALYHVD